MWFIQGRRNTLNTVNLSVLQIGVAVSKKLVYFKDVIFVYREYSLPPAWGQFHINFFLNVRLLLGGNFGRQ